jgi:lipoprotein-anchoring transpeptidase ErfK/SrfK
MANILLRSPRLESVTVPSAMNSVELELTINGTLRYNIVKNGTVGTVLTFEIAELVRDYLNVTFNGTYTAQTADISFIYRYWSLPNGGGGGYSSSATTHKGFDGYGTFMEGINPTVSSYEWLIEKDVIKDGYYFYAPLGVSGVVPVSTNSVLSYTGFDTSNPQTISLATPIGNVLVNIIRVNCSRYGEGNKITFVNKYGALQDLWFFLKSVKTTTSTKETYNANTITISGGNATYSVNNPTKTVFNKSANQKIILSSGYYPEGANPFFEDLMLSKQIWLTQADPYDPSTEQVVPVIINTSSFTYKTSLNDKLIEYTMEFDMAFDYINNVR